jgi:beta-lactamase class A
VLSAEAYIAQMESMVAELFGHYGVVVAEQDGTSLYSHAASDQFESASLYKLGVMVETYRQRELGLLSFDDLVYMREGFFQEAGDDEWLDISHAGEYFTVEALLLEMIDASSNAAAWALLDHVGTENVNAAMAELGLSATFIRWSPSGGWFPSQEPEPEADEESVEDTPDEELPAEDEPEPGDSNETTDATEEPTPSGAVPSDLAAYAWVDESTPNVTTAEDLAWLYAQLLQGLVVSPDASAEMLDLLAQQQINDRLPAYLPEGTVVAHKTGNLDGMVHDAGVIYAPAGPVIVVVLSDEVNSDEANLFIARLGELTYWYFS